MPKTILTIEDNPVEQALITRVLEKAGYRVVAARNGKEGLDLVQTQPVDLIIIDVLLPDVRGTEVFEQIVELLVR